MAFIWSPTARRCASPSGVSSRTRSRPTAAVPEGRPGVVSVRCQLIRAGVSVSSDPSMPRAACPTRRLSALGCRNGGRLILTASGGVVVARRDAGCAPGTWRCRPQCPARTRWPSRSRWWARRCGARVPFLAPKGACHDHRRPAARPLVLHQRPGIPVVAMPVMPVSAGRPRTPADGRLSAETAIFVSDMPRFAGPTSSSGVVNVK